LYLGILVLLVHTARLQLAPDPRVVRQASRQYWARIPVSTSRGDIRDRNGIPLAISVPAWSFFLDPQEWNPRSADILVPLGKAVTRKARSSLSGRFQWLDRKVDGTSADLLAALKVPGLHALREKRRTYPHGRLASHVLGYCDIDDNGLAGVERAWNNLLFSPPQARLLARDARGRFLDVIGSSAEGGGDSSGSIRLTLDSRFQQVLEWRLDEGSREARAKWAAGICLDPRTGEVLAMASWPPYNPNRREELAGGEAIRNNAIGRVYEPGSTFKPIIMGMALDAGLVSPSDRFLCNGRVKIADGVIRDVHSSGVLDAQGVIVKSSNVGMALIGTRFQPHRAYGMLRMFGMGSRSGIEIAGEEEGLLKPPEQWLGTVPANIAIGQGVAVTPIQLAVGIAAVVNGGDLLKPYLIGEVRNGLGQVIHQGHRRVRAEVLSSWTSAWLREAMRKVVLDGTGKGANSTLTEVGGKTGTAQIASRGEYQKGNYVASFVGFWPYRDPRFVMVIVFGEPQGARYYGGEIAAPVFRNVVDDIMQIAPNP
jgi:cell division protein FtsI (penicillin-binding protein 3)/stage V sporulation protein D (sporulation-specific penicillin-binding protein)